MGFSNYLTTKMGTLVAQAIKSPNFVLSPLTGWSLDKNGNFFAGNATLSGTITASTFQGTDFVINSSGAFFYSGTPAFGNLIESIAQSAGTDSFGNAYLEGHVTYSPGSPSIATRLGQGNMFFYKATSMAGPWTQQATAGLSIVGASYELVINSNIGPVYIDGTGSNGVLVIQGGPYLSTDGANLGVFPALSIPSAGAGNNAISTRVQGDTTNRYQVDSNGQIQWGPGAVTAVDTNLYRSAANTLKTDDSLVVAGTVTATGGTEAAPTLITTDTTHGLGALGQTGITVSVSNYYLLPDGGVFISIKGSTTGTAIAAGSKAFPTTLPAALRPATDTWLAGFDAQSQLWGVHIGTAGAVTLFWPALTTTTRNWSVLGRIDLQ